jgi:lipopolysaccharide/colanic/teichoic acid biosynthesis glycosyltransferase
MKEDRQKRVSKRISRAVGRLCKRIFDLLASAIGLILLSPLLLAIAVFIKLKMPGPVLFRQERIGRNGKPFTIFKFRSMTLNHQGSTISVKGEKRITPLGAFLRKHKFDELPELWNVVCGDMSLVGPRPDMPGYANQLVGEEKLILKLRPGITGPASLKYANEEELLAGVADPVKYNDEIIWPDKVRINLDYYYNRSFLGDILIIFKTIF